MVAQLLSNPAVDPAAFGDFALRAAAANGHVETVRLLLRDPRVQPSARQNQALRLASANGHVAVVEELLLSPQLKHDSIRFALAAACFRSHIAVAERLLADPRILIEDAEPGDTHVAVRLALEGAITSRNTHLLEQLLAHALLAERKHILAAALETAAQVGDVEAVGQLLATEFPDFGSAAADALTIAARCGHVPVVARIAADGRAAGFGFARLQDALDAAAEGGSGEAIDCIMALPGLQGGNALQHSRALTIAGERGHVGALRRLLHEPRFSDAQVQRALIAAAEEDNSHAIECLVQLGDDGDKRLRLAGASCTQRYEWTRGGLVEGTSSLGAAALKAACASGSAQCVATLMSYRGAGVLDSPAVAEDCIAAAFEGARFQLMRPLPEGKAPTEHLAAFELLLADPRVPPALVARFKRSAAACRTSARLMPSGVEEIEVRYSFPQWPGKGKRTGKGRAAGAGSAAAPAATWASARATFHAAMEVGDVDGVKTALAQPLLDPQAPLGSHTDKSERYSASESVPRSTALLLAAGPDPPHCFKANFFSLNARVVAGSENAARRLAVTELLLADPCWEPRHVNEALERACSVDNVAVAERLLADPRCELSTVPHEHCELGRLSDPRVASPFDAAAAFARAGALSLLVAEGRARGLTAEGMGARILHGLRERHKYGGRKGAAGVQRVVNEVPAALHACIALLDTTAAPFPSFMRRAIDATAIGAAAWARRRHIVVARARAMAGYDGDDDEDNDANEDADEHTDERK